MSRRLFTSESVTEGHPDKIADQISDSILDALLTEDPHQPGRGRDPDHDRPGARRRRGHHRRRTPTSPGIVRERILEIGYDSSAKGFDGHSCGVSISIGAQSPDIAQGVDDAYEHRAEGDEDPLDRQGAGDQGLMFGYACDDTPELMPLPIALAHRLAQQLTSVRKDGAIPYLRPDGKTQVTIEYDGDRAVRLDTVVVSSQHAADIDLDSLLQPDIAEQVVKPVLDGLAIDTTRLPAAGQPDRPVRDRRPDGRRRPHRSQDHRRHLRRHGPPRRRRLLRQGPVQGRPLGRLRDALGRQERRRRRAGPPLRGAGRLRDRQGAPGRPVRRDVRHRDGAGRRRSRTP